MSDGSSANGLSVIGNELLNIATEENCKTVFEYAAIYLQNVLAGAVSDNSINLVGQNPTRAKGIAGVRLEGCLDVRISDTPSRRSHRRRRSPIWPLVSSACRR